MELNYPLKQMEEKMKTFSLIFSKQKKILLREKLELVSFPLQGFDSLCTRPTKCTVALSVFVLMSMTGLSCRAVCAGRDAVKNRGIQ